MAKYPGLMRRGSRWYLRAKVPADLVEEVGRREIWRSLETGSHRKAVGRYHQVRGEVQALLEAARRRLRGGGDEVTDAELRRLAAMWFQGLDRKVADADHAGPRLGLPLVPALVPGPPARGRRLAGRGPEAGRLVGRRGGGAVRLRCEPAGAAAGAKEGRVPSGPLTDVATLKRPGRVARANFARRSSLFPAASPARVRIGASWLGLELAY